MVAVITGRAAFGMTDVGVALEGHMTQSASAAPFLRIGSRGSPLALVQAREVQSRIAAAAGVDAARIEIKAIRTTGDVVQDRPLADAGGKGLFTRRSRRPCWPGASISRCTPQRIFRPYCRRGLF